MPKSQKSVIVIGGGVAGIAAATALAEAGLRVQLYEKRPLLGGRASSFIDPQTGERLDAAQHGTMRCCTNLAKLLENLGVHDRVRYHDVIHFLDSEGKRSVLAGSRLPAPLHTGLSFLTFQSLGLADKLAIARGMVAMLRAKPRAEHDAEDILSWYRRNGQTERAIRRFWEPVLVSACNESLDRISCAYAFMVFRDAFLAHPHGFHFGIPTVPLGSLYTEPTLAYLQRRGGCAGLRTIVDQVHFESGRISGVTLQDGDRLEAEIYVSALQFDLLLKLLPSEVTQGVPYFDKMKQIELSPLIGVHLWFEGKIDCPDAIALLDRRSDWIFNKHRNFGLLDDGSTYLSVVISADRDLADMPKDDALALVLGEVREALPETRKAKLIRGLVVKERKATFSPKPGADSLRPDQRSPTPNLYIAGEWTNTGWPSTMESACRSGYLAAERILEDLGQPRRLLAPDLPVAGLCRFLMRR